MEYRDRTFENEEVLLDGNVFSGCTFRSSTMVFKAIAPVGMTACTFRENMRWGLDGPAALTVGFLTAMYHGSGAGGRELIEQTFKTIRESKP